MSPALSSDGKLRVLLAPALAVERATSMDVYAQNVGAALAALGHGIEMETVAPASSPEDSPWAKIWQRHVLYPRLLARRVRQFAQPLVHILDHSYGHLCTVDPPTVITCHGLENFDLPLKIWRQQALWVHRVRGMRRARRVIAVSREVAGHVAERIGIAPARIVVNHNGVHPGYHPFSAAELDDAAAPTFLAPLIEAKRAGALLVLHVGTNVARKDLDTLLRAIALLKAQNAPIRLIKAGIDLRVSGYGDLITSLGLDGQVISLGMLSADELAHVYNRCDVLGFPSLYEGFGLPIVEAQACGLPVVTADTPSAREIAGPGALRHEPRGVEDLARQIRAAGLDPAVRAALREAGLAHSVHFTWHAHALRLLAVYEEVHAENAARPSAP